MFLCSTNKNIDMDMYIREIEEWENNNVYQWRLRLLLRHLSHWSKFHHFHLRVFLVISVMTTVLFVVWTRIVLHTRYETGHHCLNTRQIRPTVLDRIQLFKMCDTIVCDTFLSHYTNQMDWLINCRRIWERRDSSQKKPKLNKFISFMITKGLFVS